MRHISLDVAFENEVRKDAFDLIHVHGVSCGNIQRQLKVLHLQLVILLDQVTAETIGMNATQVSLSKITLQGRLAREGRTLS